MLTNTQEYNLSVIIELTKDANQLRDRVYECIDIITSDNNPDEVYVRGIENEKFN